MGKSWCARAMLPQFMAIAEQRIFQAMPAPLRGVQDIRSGQYCQLFLARGLQCEAMRQSS